MCSLTGEIVPCLKSSLELPLQHCFFSMPQINDQRRCKAGWAFAAAGAMEGQVAKSSGQLLALSAQQLVDCSWKYGSQGCNGGSPSKAFSYIVDNGICSSINYPFLGFVSRYCLHFSQFFSRKKCLKRVSGT